MLTASGAAAGEDSSPVSKPVAEPNRIAKRTETNNLPNEAIFPPNPNKMKPLIPNRHEATTRGRATLSAPAEIWAALPARLAIIHVNTITCRPISGTAGALPSAMKLRISILLALAAGAFAQDPAPLKLTLRDAVQLALKQNPRVILANLGVAQSEQERNLARSALFPQVGGHAGETVNRVNLESSIGFRFPGFSQHTGPYRYEQIGIGFTAEVLDLTLWRRYRASQAGIDTLRAQETTVREESVMLVVSQYLGSPRAAADVEAARSRVELAQALYDQAADLLKNGVGTGIDTLRSNVQLQNEKQRLIVARTQLETALYALARLLNVDARQRVELADVVSFFDTPEVNVDQTLERAYQARPELRQILSRQQRAALEMRVAGDARLPKVSVSGFWAEQGLNNGTAIPVYSYSANLDV